jgi:hypothetical protein
MSWSLIADTFVVCCGHRRQIEMSARGDRRSANQIHYILKWLGQLQNVFIGAQS